MAYRNAEADLKRAKELRKLSRDVRDGTAKEAFEAAATRLERRAGVKARKLGRTKRVANPSKTTL